MCHDFPRELGDWERLLREAAEAAEDGEEPPEPDLAPPPIETAEVAEPELGQYEIDEPDLD